MKNFRVSLGAAAFAGMLVLGGCDFLGSGGSEVEDNSPVLAVVNGVNITEKDLDSAIAQLPPNIQAVPREQLTEPLMNTLIETQLLAAKGDELGLGDDQEFLHQMKRFRVFSLRESYATHVQDAGVTDAALQEAYERTVVDQELTKEVNASHILVADEEAAIGIIAELDGGADFAALAIEHSLDPASERGGELGFFPKNAMVEEFATAAFALELGAHSAAAVQTQFGWHIIKVNEIREVEPPAFQSMRASLERELREKVLIEAIAELTASAEVERIGGVPEEAEAEPEPEAEPEAEEAEAADETEENGETNEGGEGE